MNLGVMAMKKYNVFLKAPALLEPHHQNVDVVGSYSSAEKQPVYSTASAD